MSTPVIQLSIVTPQRTVYDAAVEQVTCQTIEGEITVLPHHIPFVGVLKPGELRIRSEGEETVMVSAGGFIQVASGGSMAILADEAERVDELDAQAISGAHERAQQALKEQSRSDDLAFAAAAVALERESARMRVVRKYRRGRREV